MHSPEEISAGQISSSPFLVPLTEDVKISSVSAPIERTDDQAQTCNVPIAGKNKHFFSF
jgi:hypothetical protein